LRWLTLSPPQDGTLDLLRERLQVDRPVLVRLLHGLVGLGLIESGNVSWQPTPLGRRALEEDGLNLSTCDRRVFYFVDNQSLGQPPHYLSLTPPPGPLPSTNESGPFDPALLEECIRQTSEWKDRHRFPAEVEAIERFRPEEASSWRSVILDRPELLPVAWIETAPTAAGPRLLGFGVRADGWNLEVKTPVLALPEGWSEALPDVAEEPAAEVWRQAWLAWCQPRGLPIGEVEACRLEPAGTQLRVRAPERLLDRLRQARSDAVKGEAWLLVGSGRTRVAAQIDLRF
jgi:hypothetical protein